MSEMSKEIIFSRAVIQKRVQEMAGQISKDYAGSDLVILRARSFLWLI
jgi:hypoxanthine-guanine phosphoribosyltransferase